MFPAGTIAASGEFRWMDQKENQMATKLQDTKAVKGSSGEHGGNRRGNQDKKDKPQKSSQAAGKDPKRGKD